LKEINGAMRTERLFYRFHGCKKTNLNSCICDKFFHNSERLKIHLLEVREKIKRYGMENGICEGKYKFDNFKTHTELK